MSEQNWLSFALTDVGKKRKVNQDAIYSDDNAKIWLVADGMGGHRDGDKASQAIVAAMKSRKFSNTMAERVIEIEQLIRQLNDELQQYSKQNLNGQNTGSTLVLLTMCEGVCAIVWAGDSRCYRLAKGEIEQVSWDHSYVEEMLRAGKMAEEEAAASKMSNIITRAVGAHDALFFDHVIFPYSDQETYLLCSDGLTNEMTDKDINEVISNYGCSQKSVDILLATTLAHGARDNVSIITVASKQRRPINNSERQLMANHTNSIRSISQTAFDNEIGLDEYYRLLKKQIDTAIQEHQQFKGQGTKETAAIVEPEKPIVLTATDRFQIPAMNAPKSKIDIQYVLFAFALITLLSVLFYLFTL